MAVELPYADASKTTFSDSLQETEVSLEMLCPLHDEYTVLPATP